MRIAVAIASVGRPTLAATLATLAAQRLPDGAALDVIVADDGPPGAVEAITRAAPLPVRVVPAGARNIALTRNASLAAARDAEWIAFIDDDEEADPDWLADLLATASRHGADVVFGPVEPIYPPDAPRWAVRAGLYTRRHGSDGRAVATGNTGNALVRASALGEMRFDPRYGRTGGEDTDLFARLGRTGARMVAAERGAVRERVPPELLRLDHLAVRYTRGGHSYARIALERRGAFGRVAFYAAAASKSLVAGLGAAMLAPIAPHRAIGLALRHWGNRGKLLYGLGRPAPSPYAHHDGMGGERPTAPRAGA